jgi:hypothetical protein
VILQTARAKSLALGLSWAACLPSCAARHEIGGSETQPFDAAPDDAATNDAATPSDGGSRDAGRGDAEPSEASIERSDATASTGSGVSFDSSVGSSWVTASEAGSRSSASSSDGSTSGDVTSSWLRSSVDVSTSSGAFSTTGDSATLDAGSDVPVPPPTVAPDLTDVTQFELVDCVIEPAVALAPKVPMVGIATFETNLLDAERALIQFGTAEQYTLEAPVEWNQLDHRTLLLGTPSNTEVHYRVVVIKGDQACVGPDAAYETGGPVAGVPTRITPLDGPSAAEPSPGFIVAVRSDYAYIVNKDGYVVWAHRFPTTLTRANISWDGKYLLGRDLGPFNASAGGMIFRVGMDGEGERQLNVSGGSHHDFTVIPEGIAYIAKDQVGDCDSLYTARIDGSESAPLVNLGIVFDKFALGPQASSPERCHVNSIRYYHDAQRFSLADREKDAIAFFSKSGTLLGSIGAAPIEATPNHILAQGADSTANSPWRVQHGHDLYAPDKLIVWSNGILQGGTSRMLHYTIVGTTATLDWQYTGTGTSPILSDAQHLPNGNFLGTNTANGTVHEIDPSRNLVRSYTGLSRGYPVHRTTLYGPPPGR